MAANLAQDHKSSSGFLLFLLFFLLFLLFCFDPIFSFFFFKSSYYSYFFIKKVKKKIHVSQILNQMKWDEVRWIRLFNVTFNVISVIYVTAHRCAGGLKKKLNLWSGSQRHRHFAGFFNVPVQEPTRDHPFYGYSEKPPHFSRLLWHAWWYGGYILNLTPGSPRRIKWSKSEIYINNSYL